MNDNLPEWLRARDSEAAADLERMKRLAALLDQYHREHWQRHVSFGDAITDRWERARRLGFGEGTSVYDSALVLGDVTVGRNTWIGPNTVLDGSGGLVIGNHCSISAGTQIYSHDSVAWAVTGGEAEVDRAATRIGSNTYIGPTAIISKGVTIGNRCIVGAASLVLSDVPDNTIVHGTPARTAGHVDEFLERHGARSQGPANPPNPEGGA